jgi:hypothetical protein
MKKFYVTYGMGTNLGYCFSIVEADNYAHARNILHRTIGSKFAFCYTESEWILDDGKTQQERYKLREVPLQAQVNHYD